MNNGKFDLPPHNLNAVPLRRTLATLAHGGDKALWGAPGICRVLPGRIDPHPSPETVPFHGIRSIFSVG